MFFQSYRARSLLIHPQIPLSNAVYYLSFLELRYNPGKRDENFEVIDIVSAIQWNRH